MTNQFLRLILHILYPTRCPVCGKFIGFKDDFCIECKDALTLYDENFTIPGADGFCASFVYDNNISPAIMLLKDGICGNAAYALGTALAYTIRKCSFHNNVDAVVPTPMHKSDLKLRGYNQSELIARVVSEILGIKMIKDAVIKNRKTRNQKSLNRSEREKNLKEAFNITKPEKISGKRILLIDDICTTGSTMKEITKTLKENNAVSVICACCCKTLYYNS